MIVSIFDIPTIAQTFSEAVDVLLQWSQSQDKHYVCTCPVYTLMIAQEIPQVKSALQSASMVTADGIPIMQIQRCLARDNAERVYGPDLMFALCEKGQSLGIKHYFLGALPGISEKLSEKLQAQLPDLQIVGADSLPIIDLENMIVDPDLLEKLNASQADIIWVGLGSPKQDLWMQLYRPYLTAPLLIGVGAAFDFLSGTKLQAPKWMQKSGLEWVFRLVQEPRRLGKRYLVYNTRFILAVMKEIVRRWCIKHQNTDE